MTYQVDHKRLAILVVVVLICVIQVSQVNQVARWLGYISRLT